MITTEKQKEIVKYLEDQVVEYEVFMKSLNQKRESDIYNYNLGMRNAFKYMREVLKEIKEE